MRIMPPARGRFFWSVIMLNMSIITCEAGGSDAHPRSIRSIDPPHAVAGVPRRALAGAAQARRGADAVARMERERGARDRAPLCAHQGRRAVDRVAVLCALC